MLTVLRSLLPKLEHGGAFVDMDTRPDIDFGSSWFGGMRLIGAAAGVSGNDRSTTHTDWLFADRSRARTRVAWADYFTQVDVLLCPISVTPAIPHNQHGTLSERWMKVGDRDVRYVLVGVWTALIGSVYLASTSVPVGHTADGLPVGVQVVAPYLHDRTAIALGGLISELADGYRVPPCACCVTGTTVRFCDRSRTCPGSPRQLWTTRSPARGAEGSSFRRSTPLADYSILKPDMARAITSCWISDVPSKIVWVSPGCPGRSGQCLELGIRVRPVRRYRSVRPVVGMKVGMDLRNDLRSIANRRSSEPT